MGQVIRVTRFSLLPYCPPAPPVSYKVPRREEPTIAPVQIYLIVYPAPFVAPSEVNLMYTWVVEESSTNGLEALTTGVEQELRRRGALLADGPS